MVTLRWRPTRESNPESNGFASRRTTVVKWAELGPACPRQESNLRSRLRTPASYPLDHEGLRRMQDSNLRDALTPTTVFGTVALPGSANPPCRTAQSDARESNAVTPDPKSGGVASAPRIRRPAYPPPIRRPVPLPGLEPGTSAFVVRRSVHLSYRGEVETSARLHRRSSWLPLSATGTSFGKSLLLSRFALNRQRRAPAGGVEPLDTVLEAVPLPKLADRELLSRSKKREAAHQFPDGRLPDITRAMAS